MHDFDNYDKATALQENDDELIIKNLTFVCDNYNFYIDRTNYH